MGTAYLVLSVLYALFAFYMSAFGVFAIGNALEVVYRKIKERVILK